MQTPTPGMVYCERLASVPNNRTRGRRGELNFAAAIGGHRISRTGEPGPDVMGPDGRTYEVKLVKELPQYLKDFVAQADRQGCAAVAIKEDRGRWLMLARLENWQ